MHILKIIGLFLLAIILFETGLSLYHHIEGWTAPEETVSFPRNIGAKMCVLMGAYFYGWIMSNLVIKD